MGELRRKGKKRRTELELDVVEVEVAYTRAFPMVL